MSGGSWLILTSAERDAGLKRFFAVLNQELESESEAWRVFMTDQNANRGAGDRPRTVWAVSLPSGRFEVCRQVGEYIQMLEQNHRNGPIHCTKHLRTCEVCHLVMPAEEVECPRCIARIRDERLGAEGTQAAELRTIRRRLSDLEAQVGIFR